VFPHVPISEDWSSALLGMLSQPWLFPEQAGNDDMFWGPASPQQEPGFKRHAAIKQRDGDKVRASD